MMERFPIYFFVLLSFFTIKVSYANDIKINFASVNINDARKQAGSEGKLIFIDFHADWCSPCKWMDQTTFRDETVAKVLNDNFVSVKVDIDQLEGYELKNMYDVKYLPTMLIFNSQGQLLDRVEETLSPRKLLVLLEKHNAAENKIIIRHDFNTAPSAALKKPEVVISESMLQTSEEYNKYFYKSQTGTMYRIQVGVFERYQGASDMVNTLRELFTEPVSVINEYKNNAPMFKVRVGQFITSEEAERFKQILKNEYNIEGIVQ
jgi:thioredoxin 1